MKLTSLLVLLALCISAPAFAKGKPAPAPVRHQSASSTEIHWNVAGPFELIGGTALFGAYFSGDYFIRNDISVGGESGFWIGSSNSVTLWEIPIVVTGKYHFAMASMPNWRPYVGAGMGLGIFQGGVSTAVAGAPVSASSTSANFHGELKVGTSFEGDKGLMAEIRLGLVGSSFLFAPTIGWNL